MLPTDSPDELLTPSEVAALLYVDPKTVSRWAAAGKIAAVRGPGGHHRYLRSEVLAIVSGLHPDRWAPGHDRDNDQDSAAIASDGKDISPGSSREGDSERQAAAAAVVGDAVALALETAADEAAEAARVTSAAVSEAARRASGAAEGAREARAFAARAAALSIALEAERTAGRVRDRAASAAAQVKEAASLAADELARCIAGDLELDAGHMAELLAATVRVAAEAMQEETKRAANAVKIAESAAAAHVVETLAAAEAFVEREVSATADAQRELAAATAQAVALETDAQAAVLALAAGEAAVALLTDELWARTVDSMSGLKRLQIPASAGEVRAPDRAREMTEILAAAAAMDRIYAVTDEAPAASDLAENLVQADTGAGGHVPSGDPPMSEAAAELSHDLRVPLTSIIASLEMLEDELRDHSGGSTAALLGRATRAGDRMVRMLEQNMTSSADDPTAALPQVDLAAVVRQLVQDSANLLEPVGASVEAGELPVVHAYLDGMYSVLQNLLTNSLKFARPGVPAKVRISARRSGDAWRITVRDNGVGLPEMGDLDIFSLFSRGTTTVTGHGIGLATVARIVSLHGGQVGTSPVKTGAEIWFELPADELLPDVPVNLSA